MSKKRRLLLSGNVWPQKSNKAVLQKLKKSIPVLPPNIRHSQTQSSFRKQSTNVTNFAEHTFKSQDIKSYMDSDFNPSIKENFKRDDFMKKLDPATSEV